MHINFKFSKIFIIYIFLVSNLFARINIFSSEASWEGLIKEICGDKVTVFSATNSSQDPHYIAARPSLIAKIRSADMLVITGSDLEIGWLPVLLKFAKKQVQYGEVGYFEATSFVKKLEVITSGKVDRSLGDVHSDGNPHIQLDPRRMLIVAENFVKRICLLDKENKSFYEAQFNKFKTKLLQKIKIWEEKALSLKGVKIITYHKNWTYLADWLKLDIVNTVEPKPGLPPNINHLNKLFADYQRSKISFILYSSYDSPRPNKWLAERLAIPANRLASVPDKDFFIFYDSLIEKLVSIK